MLYSGVTEGKGKGSVANSSLPHLPERVNLPRFVYRALHIDEDPDLGLRAVKPDAELAPSAAVGRGSRAEANSQYIHCTTKPEAALWFADCWKRKDSRRTV